MELNEVHTEHEHATTSLKVLLLVFAIVLVGALAYLVWAQNTAPDTTDNSTAVSKTATPSTSTTTDKLSGLKTYSNSKYGFSFSYSNALYLFENNAQYVAMCQKEDEVEGSINVSPACDDRQSDVLVVGNINGYCTKGGCVGTNLVKIDSPPNRAGFSVSIITPEEKVTWVANLKKYASATTVGSVETYSVTSEALQKAGVDGSPSFTGLFSASGKQFVITTFTETGAEAESIAALKAVVATLKIAGE